MERTTPDWVKLKQEPDDIEGWLLLGRAYKTTQRFAGR